MFGAGFESFWTGRRLDEYWGRHIWRTAEAHNGYLEVYLNLGWVGVSLLALIIVTGYRNASGMLRWDREGGGLRLAFFIVGVTYSFAEAGFRLLNPVWILFLLSATAVPKTAGARDSLAEPVTPEPRMAKATKYRYMGPVKQQTPSHLPAGSINRKSAART